MSDGSFWRTKKLESELREQETRILRARRLLTEALDLIGGPTARAENQIEKIFSDVADEMMNSPPPPPPVGYMICEGCSRERRCYAVSDRKICMTCRRKEFPNNHRGPPRKKQEER